MKAVKTGDAPDYAKCDEKLLEKWTEIESEGGAMCPTSGDQAAIQTLITDYTDTVATALSGGGWVGCGQRVKTGQTTCYDSANMLIACPGTGQDGELQKGLGVSFIDNGDGTISDQRTGLMWEKLSDDGSIHDKDTSYSWADTVATKIAALNTMTFGGYDDWRLPNVNELQSLINYGASAAPVIHAPFYTGCVAGCTISTCSCTDDQFNTPYWCSTTYPFGLLTHRAYVVEFANGLVNAEVKTVGRRVRAVRGGV
jgi:hypothetical protein